MLYPGFKLISQSLFLILLLVWLSACAVTPQSARDNFSVFPLNNYVDLNNSALVQQQLLQHYREWSGTQYKKGGLNRQGVDCSGFVYVTYRTRLGLEIPRTTELQMTIGSRISKTELRAGDLIFFKTGFLARHIGIYLGNGQFMHASSSRGVTLSSLKNTYWQAKYWLSRRVEA